MVFLAVATIVLALLLNGLPPPWLLRRLDALADRDGELQESAARAAVAKAERIAAARRLRLLAIEADRDCMHSLHAQNIINDETLRVFEQELDEREIGSSADPLRG